MQVRRLTREVWDRLSPEVHAAIAEAKADEAWKNRSSAARARVARQGLALTPKPCGVCGKEYQPTGGRQLACVPCRDKHKKPDRLQAWRPKIAEANRARWAAGDIFFPNRECGACGVTYAPSSGAQKWCSTQCRHLVGRMARYGLTVTNYRRLHDQQGGRCALCKEEWMGWGSTPQDLHVDHCHDSGRVRGLLCGDCNTAIGRFGDDPARLRLAAEYLER